MKTLFTVAEIKRVIGEGEDLELAAEVLCCDVKELRRFRWLFMRGGRKMAKLDVEDGVLRGDYERLGNINALARHYHTSVRVLRREMQCRGIPIRPVGYNGK